jgi:signal transduction histidine kinase
MFAILLMAALWTLQILFLNSYYQEMRISETSKVATEIETIYQSGEKSEIRDRITEIYRKSEMYIQIESVLGIRQYIPYADEQTAATTEIVSEIPEESDGNSSENNVGNAIEQSNADGSETLNGDGAKPESEVTNDDVGDVTEEAVTKEKTAPTPLSQTIYQKEINQLKKLLLESDMPYVTKEVTDPANNQKSLEYAAYLSTDGEDNNLLFIFSPLYPMGSTINILRSQLIWVTIISIISAILLSIYLSRKITQPITNIINSTAELAEGNYGIVFEGAHYSEIIKLADTLTYTSRELAKADNMMKDLIANVSHDLRTPLTMVTSYAEMIRDISGNDPEKRNQHLQVIIDEAERLNQLVTDMLEVHRMQAGRENLNLTDFSMKDSIESILQSYLAFVEQEGYKIVFISQGAGKIRADEARLKQVISNLVSNAIKYSGRDKTVEVKMLDDKERIRVEVTDHGVGIPKKDLRHIWERYYKASTNHRRSDSTGLGLSIVKEILVLHSASFGVESTLKKGSTFWFEIRKNLDPANEARLIIESEEDEEERQ